MGTCFNQEHSLDAKRVKLWKIFNEQIALILSRGKNLSKRSALIHGNAKLELFHMSTGLFSKIESLKKSLCTHVWLSASWNLGVLTLNLCHSVCSWTWAKGEQQQQQQLFQKRFNDWWTSFKCIANYIDHLTWSTNSKIRSYCSIPTLFSLKFNY